MGTRLGFLESRSVSKVKVENKNYNQNLLSMTRTTTPNLTLFVLGEGVGLGAFLVERSFFPENERNDQERPHRSEKKTNA